jgi:2-methylisocitrate lyase-like PEP mutase family enzyme
MAAVVTDLASHAAHLRSLHRGPELLVLANAWDVPSARAVESAGFPAVATSSHAVAELYDVPDNGVLGAPAFATVAAIAAAVNVPVTADLEDRYGMAPGDFVDALITAGAVGCNLEDTDQPARRASGERTLVPVDVQAERLAAVKQAGRDAGVDIVLNARVDCWVLGLDDRDALIETSVERGRAYLAAGADCVYPIGAADEDDLRAIVAGVGGPVNVYLRKGIPDLDTLQRIGVARASMGSGLFRIAQAAIADAAARIRAGDLSILE